MKATISRRSGPTPARRVGIVWDGDTLVRVQGGATYGRMTRARPGGAILCSFERDGRAWVNRSADEGRTWGAAPVLVREIPGSNAANPELLALRDGRLLLFYNQRPRDGKRPFAIGVCASDDEGRTWRAAPRNIYEAGRTPDVGCWEPAAVQLPSGEIHLFFANEFPYPRNDDQEITRMRSRDNGATWGRPETVAYRAGHRDGMPVPLLLQNSPDDITLAIEDNGLMPDAKLQPAILSVPRGPLTVPIGGGSSRRWGAISPSLSPGVYAGAPYIRQMPSGETILSCQSDQTVRQKPRMVVYVGDPSARRFTERSIPFPVPTGVGGYWNALFVKNAETITAISDTIIRNSRGLWAIDGHLRPVERL